MYLSEFILDQTDLPLEDYHAWVIEDVDYPCFILDSLGEVINRVTEKMNELEPDFDNLIYLRLPICVGS